MSTSTQKPCTGDAGLPRNLPATSKRGGNSSVAKSPSEQALRPTACLSVFDGRTAVGHVVAWNGRGYEAYGADDVSFGFFPSPESAVSAISAAVVDGTVG